jgi:hypothetical protein
VLAYPDASPTLGKMFRTQIIKTAPEVVVYLYYQLIRKTGATVTLYLFGRRRLDPLKEIQVSFASAHLPMNISVAALSL